MIQNIRRLFLLSLHHVIMTPCRHADVMKKIMKMIEEDGRLLEVHSYPCNVNNNIILLVDFLNETSDIY